MKKCNRCGKLYADCYEECPNCVTITKYGKRIISPSPAYTPHCPICGSPDVRPIGFGERAVSVAAVGLFSKKINKSYICNNCKATF